MIFSTIVNANCVASSRADRLGLDFFFGVDFRAFFRILEIVAGDPPHFNVPTKSGHQNDTSAEKVTISPSSFVAAIDLPDHGNFDYLQILPFGIWQSAIGNLFTTRPPPPYPP